MPTDTRVEESALATRTDEVSELTSISSSAGLEAEIKAAITVALKFPRNEDAAFQKLMRSCKRTSFAEDVNYSFPRGNKMVTGPSINLAREAARVWGNIRHGCNVVVDTEDNRTIEAWAWDLETNTKVTQQDTFGKLIYRKADGGKWIKPDERELRELQNRRAAIAKRNCILEILPKDLIEDARETAQATLKEKAEKDPDGERKRILVAFSDINVDATMLAQKLGHPLQQSSPAEIAELRQIFKSISDGQSRWNDYVNPPATPSAGPESAVLTVADVLKAGTAARMSNSKLVEFIQEKFQKSLTSLEAGDQCGNAIAMIQDWARENAKPELTLEAPGKKPSR